MPKTISSITLKEEDANKIAKWFNSHATNDTKSQNKSTNDLSWHYYGA